MHKPSNLLSRIHRLKLVVVGLLLLVAGLAATVAADWLSDMGLPRIFQVLADGVADVLLVAGALGIAVDFFVASDKEAADVERLRDVLIDAAPEIRDAVVMGFAESPDHLRGVATPETLDNIATNALALRLGDDQFAREIYADLRDQAIRTSERWSDVDVTVRLSTVQGPSTELMYPAGDLFEVLVTWDYALVPKVRVQKFACVNNRDDFHELTNELPATATWFLSPRTNMRPTDRNAYELLQFSVDGHLRPIRRSVTKSRQTYAVDLGEDVVEAGQPVKIRHTVRTVLTPGGHWLQLALTQPARNISFTLDYTDTNISTLQVTDMVSSVRQPWVSYLPQDQSTKVVSLEIPGWVLPKAAVTFIWTLDDEAATTVAQPSSTVRASRRSE